MNRINQSLSEMGLRPAPASDQIVSIRERPRFEKHAGESKAARRIRRRAQRPSVGA